MNIFWFRRDLRLSDNRGLNLALSEVNNVQPIFIFDKDKALTKSEILQNYNALKGRFGL